MVTKTVDYSFGHGEITQTTQAYTTGTFNRLNPFFGNLNDPQSS